MKLQLCQLPKPLLSGRNLCLVYVAAFTIEMKSWIRREGMLISEVNFHTPICTLFLLPSPLLLSPISHPQRIHHNYRRPTVLLLDDNMALRSMRYEYYQMARKCKSPPPPSPFLPSPISPPPLYIDTVPVVVYLKRVLYFLLHPSSHLATRFCCILTCIQLVAQSLLK